MTAQISRQTRFFTTTAWEDIPEHISEREIESELFGPRHLPRLYRNHFVLSTSVPRFGCLPRPRALRGGRTRNRTLRPGGWVPEDTCLLQYGRGHGRAAGPREPVLVHVWENDHGVCSTLGHVLYNVFHRDWGWETVSKRRCVPSRCNGHVFANKKRKAMPPPTLHSGTPIFLASPPGYYSLTLGPGTGWCSNRTRCRGTVVSLMASGRTWCPTGSSRKTKIKTELNKIRDKHSHVKGLRRTTIFPCQST